MLINYKNADGKTIELEVSDEVGEYFALNVQRIRAN